MALKHNLYGLYAVLIQLLMGTEEAIADTCANCSLCKPVACSFIVLPNKSAGPAESCVLGSLLSPESLPLTFPFLHSDSDECELLCEVIAIRGTLSLDDCLTDFLCEPADLEAWIVSAKPGGLKELQRDPSGKPGKLRIPLLSGLTLGELPWHVCRLCLSLILPLPRDITVQ